MNGAWPFTGALAPTWTNTSYWENNENKDDSQSDCYYRGEPVESKHARMGSINSVDWKGTADTMLPLWQPSSTPQEFSRDLLCGCYSLTRRI